ncbi:hypothetical protein HPP92_021260 [Vanilla planifolia]|uniref:Uncharacterized protein n=1 Tax=Vanilla planifolia TaxID=51239 RepID=A0A835PXT5_VANPL|nr:hypothetical protein HPP92_021260 [Vanilla planifolia]
MAEWLSLKGVEAERRVMEAKAKRAVWIAEKDVTQLEGLGVEELEKARKLMVEAKQRVKMRQMELLFADAAIPINMLGWNTNACGSTVGEVEVETWEGGGLVMTSAKTDEEMLMRYPFSAKTDEEMLMRYPFSAAATGANLI